MLWLLRWILYLPIRILLSLRYWLTIVGKAEALKRPGPYLILPNHPAYIDPPNLLVRLWPTFRMRPMLLETNFQNPILAPFAWLIGGIRVPDTDRASAEARFRAESAVQAVIEKLRAGENVVIWSSGRLQRDGTERLGGARTVADVLAAVPETTVILVRTRGLWGSMFSWAWGHRPSLGGGLLRGLGLLLSNLIFFAPRRRVTLTLEAFNKEDRPEPTREKINLWLEGWFNADAPRETPRYVPYHFLFGPRSSEFPAPFHDALYDLAKVKPETREGVAEILQEKLKRPLTPEENNADTTFMQLGLDSLDAMEISLLVEQRYGFISETVPSSVGQLWALANGLLDTAPSKPAPAGWNSSPQGRKSLQIVGNTIPRAIVAQAFESPKQLMIADDLAGGFTYERLLIGATVMARRIRELPGPNVGLMLPAAVACDVAFLALQFAGKLPVVLNWTTGPGNLAHAVKVMQLRHVITSRAFIDRSQVEVPGAAFVYLEDIRTTIGRWELLRTLLGLRWLPGQAKRRLLQGLSDDPHSPAVVLFTSGSEKAPKAVPLTHDNILSNQRSIVAEFGLQPNDSILGFLPMFHSFGLVVTTLLPLVAGIRVVHHPDPTDSAAIARKAASYCPTLIAGTPTFLGYILDRAKPGELDSLRLVVFGAEKCPQTVFDKVKRVAPQSQVAEGYGITETAAVVSVHRPGHFRSGTLGLPLPGVQIRVLDLETDEILPPGKLGMMHVRGPNVFPGYLGYEGSSPFREIEGQHWYITGDLGELTPDGEVIFTGRLKRFLKSAGEMISLPALEEPFARLYPPTDQGPRAAVEGIEKPDGRKIVLFTTESITLRDANALLQAEGFRGILRLDEVRILEKLPILGTGKTDYKQLRSMID